MIDFRVRIRQTYRQRGVARETAFVILRARLRADAGRGPCSSAFRPSCSPLPSREVTMNWSLGGIVSWCVFGLIIGAIARFVMPGRQHMGLLLTMVLGIVGSFAGGFVAMLFSGRSDWQVNPAGWIMSIVGALLVLFIYSKTAAPKA